MEINDYVNRAKRALSRAFYTGMAATMLLTGAPGCAYAEEAQQPAQQVGASYEEALQLKRDGKYEAAEQLAEELKPTDVRAYHLDAWIDIHQGELNDAAENLQHFLENADGYDDLVQLDRGALESIRSGEIQTQEQLERERGEPVAETPISSVAIDQRILESSLENHTGEQYRYPTEMPVTMHHKQLPSDVDPDSVTVFDPEDRYHFLYTSRETGYGGEGVLYGKTWIQGDSMDILRQMYPEISSMEDFDGRVLAPDQEYVVFLARGFGDGCLRIVKKRSDGAVQFDRENLGGGGASLHDSSLEIINTETGRSLSPLQTKFKVFSDEISEASEWARKKLESPHAGFLMHLRTSYRANEDPDFDDYSVGNEEYYSAEDVYYWRFDPEGFPPGEYELRVDTSQGMETVRFEIADSEVDPFLEYVLTGDDRFEDGETIPFEVYNWGSDYNMRNTPEARNTPLEVSGTVRFVLPDTSVLEEGEFYTKNPDYTRESEEREMEMVLYPLDSSGHVMKGKEKILHEINISGASDSQCMWSLDTTGIDDGHYRLDIGVDRLHSNEGYKAWHSRPVIIDNEPDNEMGR